MSDLPIFDPGFSTPEMTALFSAASRVEAMARFEAGLAQALAEVGIAAAEEARAVVEACQTPVTDPAALLASTWEQGTPIIGLVDEIGGRIEGPAVRWLHFGTTTQDVVDTAHMLLGRRAMELFEAALIGLARTMRDLMEGQRHQLQMGRTFLQHARPTNFGLRVASWLEATLEHVVAVRAAYGLFAVQLGGPVGTLSEYGDRGPQVRDTLARVLGLETTRVAWHADRSRVWAVVQAVERSVRTMAKIAGDVSLLAGSDVGEISVRAGGSSTMSDKENPLDAIRALAAAQVCSGAASMITDSGPHELDRALGSWHTEWVAFPLVFQSGSAVLEAMERCLGSLVVHGEAMDDRVPPARRPG